MPSPSTNVMNMSFVTETLTAAMKTSEEQLRATLKRIGPNPSTTDMLEMQHQTQMWGLLAQLQSTIVKELFETMKGIVQKAG